MGEPQRDAMIAQGTLGWQSQDRFETYKTYSRDYIMRSLSFDSDIYNAFAGILSGLYRLRREKLHQSTTSHS